MAYWGGGMASGWSSNENPGGRGSGRGGRSDGWDYDELGRIYDPHLMRRLLPFLRPYRARMLLALFAMIITSAASYAQPWLIGRGVGRYVVAHDARGVMQVGIALVALAVIAWLAQWAQRILTGYVGHRLLLGLRTDLFAHLQRLPLEFYDGEEVGRVMSRITSDVAVLQDLLTSGALNVLADVFGLALIVFFLFALDAQLALLSLSVIPVLIIAMALWQRFAASSFIRVRLAIAQVNASLNENVSGVRVVQSFGREQRNLDAFDALNLRHRNANLESAQIQGVVMPLVELLSTVATVFVLAAIGRRVFGGSLAAEPALAFATAFTLYIQRFFNPVRDLVLQYTQLQRAMAGAHRVFELLDKVPAIQDPPNAIALSDVTGRVDFDHVQFAYTPDVPILHDFDLHVEPGETIAFVGETGAGKTTVTALINRSYDVQSGAIRIDGHDLRAIQRTSLTRRMAVVLQDPFLFSGTVANNIRYGRLDATDEDIHAAAAAVGADTFIARLPRGYDTVLHERGQNLSVGQRQLIAFARAVIANPRILILDEATANVDTQTERAIQHALDVVLRGRTSFVIAHRLSTIRNATRIVVMQHGRIVEIGSHEELLRLNSYYAALYRMTYERAADGTPAASAAPTSA